MEISNISVFDYFHQFSSLTICARNFSLGNQDTKLQLSHTIFHPKLNYGFSSTRPIEYSENTNVSNDVLNGAARPIIRMFIRDVFPRLDNGSVYFECSAPWRIFRFLNDWMENGQINRTFSRHAYALPRFSPQSIGKLPSGTRPNWIGAGRIFNRLGEQIKIRKEKLTNGNVKWHEIRVHYGLRVSFVWTIRSRPKRNPGFF